MLNSEEEAVLDIWVDGCDSGGRREWQLEAEGRRAKSVPVEIPLGEQIEAVRWL